MRDDDDAIVTKPPTLRKQPDGTVVVAVHAGKRGLITGSATLRSIGPPKTRKGNCRGGSSQSWTASYTDGANPLTVHPDLGRTFTQVSQKAGGSISLDAK